jgi:opacity protein-like surface antigen
MKKSILATAITTIIVSGSAASAAEFTSGFNADLFGDVFQDASQKYQSATHYDGYDSIYRETSDMDTDLTIGGHLGYDRIFALGEHKFALGMKIGGSAGGPEGSVTENWSGTYYKESSSEKGDYYSDDYGYTDAEQVDFTTESTTKQKLDWSGELLFTFGYLPLPNVMVYVAGGPVVAHATETVKTNSVNTHFDFIDGSRFVEETNDTDRNSQFGFGAMVGGGIKLKVYDNVSIDASAFYRSISFDTSSSSDEDYHNSSKYTNEGVVARLAISYHFDF